MEYRDCFVYTNIQLRRNILKFKDKSPVLGALQRHGKVVAKVVANTKHSTLIPNMVSIVSKDSIIVSDKWYIQDCFEARNHVVLDHKNEEYTRGAFHTNTIEGFWSIFKTWYLWHLPPSMPKTPATLLR